MIDHRPPTGRARAACLLIGILGLCQPAHAATVIVVNDDGAGQGFNDPEPRSPVGGNNATTLGDQRLAAFQFAADLVGARVASTVDIRVLARFGPLQCDANSGTLGAAGAQVSLANFGGTAEPDTFYPVALANALTGIDQIPPGNAFGAGGSELEETDIFAEFNGDIDNNNACLQNTNWYYGLDGNNPPGTLDLLTTVAHELIHGLGFATLTDNATGEFSQDTPDIFARRILDLDLGAWPDLSNAERAQSARNTGRVVWDGPATTANGAPGLQGNSTAAGRVRLYAPDPIEGGSSISHWDVALTPNALMEPFETGDLGVNTGIGLASCQLQDIGWTLTAGTSCPDAPGLNVTPGSLDFGAVDTGSSGQRVVTVENQSGSDLSINTIAAPAAPFSLSAQTCANGMTLPAGQSCTITVRFAPTSAGTRSDSLAISTSAGAQTVALSGTGQNTGQPSIAANPAGVAFGSRATGAQVDRTITISNAGDASLTIGSIPGGDGLAAPFAIEADTCSNTTLAAGSDCAITVRFSPTSTGTFTDSFTVPSDDPDTAQFVITVEGSGAAPPAPGIAINPASVAFGNVEAGSNADLSVRVSNSGDAALDIGAVAAANPLAAPFTITAETCSNRTFAPGGGCSITVRFSPQQTGAAADSFNINSDDPDTPTATVNVRGNGVAAAPGDGGTGGDGGGGSSGALGWLTLALAGLLGIGRRRALLRRAVLA